LTGIGRFLKKLEMDNNTRVLDFKWKGHRVQHSWYLCYIIVIDFVIIIKIKSIIEIVIIIIASTIVTNFFVRVNEGWKGGRKTYVLNPWPIPWKN
jgi:hypothetical protein